VVVGDLEIDEVLVDVVMKCGDCLGFGPPGFRVGSSYLVAQPDIPDRMLRQMRPSDESSRSRS